MTNSVRNQNVFRCDSIAHWSLIWLFFNHVFLFFFSRVFPIRKISVSFIRLKIFSKEFYISLHWGMCVGRGGEFNSQRVSFPVKKKKSFKPTLICLTPIFQINQYWKNILLFRDWFFWDSVLSTIVPTQSLNFWLRIINIMYYSALLWIHFF